MKVTDVQVWEDPSLSSLPIEILEHIFSFLDRDNLLQAMSVCTSWKSLIYSSPNLWTRQTIIFDCSLPIRKKKKVDLLFCAQNFGPHFQSLYVKCRHPFAHDCEKMANLFNLFVTSLREPVLTSFKVSGLRMQSASKIVIKKIGRALTQILANHGSLKLFEMQAAHWTTKDGRKVLDVVFQKSKDTVKTLSIGEFFRSVTYMPVEGDWFATGLLSLTKLTSLSITIFYLTDEIVVSLAQTRRGELTKLTLWANWVLPFYTHIQQDSWKYLTEACPNMEVKFKIDGYVSNPHASLPALFDSVLPVVKMSLSINKTSIPHPWPVTEMEIVLDHIRNHYGPRLKSFKLEIYNEKKENFDQSLIMLVRDCPHLDYVKVSAYYHTEDTARTIDKLVTERHQSSLTSTNSKVCTDSQAVDNASQLENRVEGP